MFARKNDIYIKNFLLKIAIESSGNFYSFIALNIEDLCVKVRNQSRLASKRSYDIKRECIDEARDIKLKNASAHFTPDRYQIYQIARNSTNTFLPDCSLSRHHVFPVICSRNVKVNGLFFLSPLPLIVRRGTWTLLENLFRAPE